MEAGRSGDWFAEDQTRSVVIRPYRHIVSIAEKVFLLRSFVFNKFVCLCGKQ